MGSYPKNFKMQIAKLAAKPIAMLILIVLAMHAIEWLFNIEVFAAIDSCLENIFSKNP